MLRPDVLVVILAGGAGTRLGALTEDRSKPSLPFAGNHRLIDFPLSNCRNSELTNVWVIEQHDPHSLIQHLANGRPWDLDRTLGGFRILHPFTSDGTESWHEGNAHALYSHREFIREHGAEHLLVLSADHIYRFDYRDLIDVHREHDGGVTVLTTQVDDASRYGVVDAAKGPVRDFWYKPDDPPTGTALTEVFLYDTTLLLDRLDELVAEHGEEDLGDFGEHLLPDLVEDGEVQALPFEGYWRDVGLVESYWEAHMDLLGDSPRLDLDDAKAPLLGRLSYRPSARLAPTAVVTDSMVSPGAVVAGTVDRSVVGPGVQIAKGASVIGCILMDDVVVDAGVRLERAIVADKARIGRDATVGGPTGELTVVPAESVVDPGAELHGQPDEPSEYDAEGPTRG